MSGANTAVFLSLMYNADLENKRGGRDRDRNIPRDRLRSMVLENKKLGVCSFGKIEVCTPTCWGQPPVAITTNKPAVLEPSRALVLILVPGCSD